jgi:hypothetical protein
VSRQAATHKSCEVNSLLIVIVALPSSHSSSPAMRRIHYMYHGEAEATNCVNELSSALQPPHEMYAPMPSRLSEKEGNIARINRMMPPAAP